MASVVICCASSDNSFELVARINPANTPQVCTESVIKLPTVSYGLPPSAMCLAMAWPAHSCLNGNLNLVPSLVSTYRLLIFLYLLPYSSTIGLLCTIFNLVWPALFVYEFDFEPKYLPSANEAIDCMFCFSLLMSLRSKFILYFLAKCLN